MPKPWVKGILIGGTTRGIYTSNLFADRVYRDLNIPLPWDEKHIPTVHGMLQQLTKSSDWEVFYTDKHAISAYNPKPGDLALWDKTLHFRNYNGTTTDMHLEHSGVIGKNGGIMYAGAESTHVFAESDFKGMCRAETYQPPSVILRSKHLAQ